MFLFERQWKLASVKFWLNWGFTLVRWKCIWVYYLSSVFYFTLATKFHEIQDIRRLGKVCNDIIIVSGFYCAFFLNSLWYHNVLFISVHGISCLKIPHLVVIQSSPTLWDPMDWHARLPCPSSTPGAQSNSCPSSQQCHPTISSSVVRFSSCLQSFPASGSFPMSQLFASGGQSIGALASVSVLLKIIQSWFPLGLTGLTSLLSKRL